MKTNHLHFKKISLFLISILLTGTSAFGATFTAITSGSWSSSTTWGGAVPPSTLLSDAVIIPVGIEVMMDNDVYVSGVLAAIDVQGTLSAPTIFSLSVSALGSITGTGTITVGSVGLATDAIMAFTGSLVTNTIITSAVTVQIAADVLVNQTLNLTAGTFSIGPGGSLNLAANGTIIISAGLLSLNGGTIGLSGTYNVTYTSGSYTTGVELTGWGLSNVTVDVSSGNTVTLSNDLFVDGTLSLTSGTLALNGNDLIITGDVTAIGNGTISSTTPGSDINVNTSSGITGLLNFSGSANIVNTLNISVGVGNQVQIAGNIAVNNSLQLTSGTLNFSGATLTISGALSGSGYLSGSISSDLIINTTGGLSNGLNFASGGQVVNNFTISIDSGNYVALVSDLTVASALNFSYGSSLNITGVTLTVFGSIIGSGVFVVNANTGLLINTSTWLNHVSLSGSSIGNFTIDVGSGSELILESDLTISGLLTTQSGNLFLNGYNLTITSTGDISTLGNGSVQSSAPSNVSIESNTGTNGYLDFRGICDVNNLNINVGSGNQARIRGNLTVRGSINLISGSLNFSRTNLAVYGVVNGTGSLSADTTSNLVFITTHGLPNTINFALGSQTINNFNVNVGSGNSVILGSALTVSGTMTITGGSHIDFSGQTLTIAGNLNSSVPFIANASSTLIVASNSGISIPISIFGGIIGTLVVNTSSGTGILLGDSLAIITMLDLQSGVLDLNGYNLIISGDIATSGTGSILSAATSNITVNSNFSPAGALRFASGAVVGDFIVNLNSGGSVLIGSDLKVADTLYFMGGSMNIGSYGLDIGTGGTISGAGSSSYVITGTNGHLGMHLNAGSSTASMFPVGAFHYSPANIKLNQSSPSGRVQVGVVDNVLSEGTFGNDISNSQPMVDATWHIASDITTNLSLNLEVMWSTTMEVNGFNRNAAYLSHYAGGNWGTTPTASASDRGNGMFSLQKNNITALSPFAVFDQSTFTTVAEITKSKNQFEIYPNPASDHLFVQSFNNSADEINVDITNVIGQVVGSYKMTDTSFDIPLSELFKGNYFIKLYNHNMNVVKRFTKL